MVRIPRLSLPSVAPQDPRQPAYAAPTSRPVQNSAPAEIARLGQGLSVAADVAFDQAKKMDDERNLAVVKQHDNALADVIRREYYDPENGYLRTRGSKALGSRRKQAEDAVEAARLQIEESLENDDQRRVFADAVSRRLQSVRAASDDHLARETTAAAIGASEAAIEGAKLDAQLQFGSDPEGFAKSLATVKGEIQNLVELTGAEEKQAELFRRKTLSGLHENVLQGLIDKKTPLSLQQAAAYLTENGGEMLPGVAQKAKSILDQAAASTTAKLVAMELRPKGVAASIEELNARFAAKKIDDATHEMAVNEVLKLAENERRAEAETDAQLGRTVRGLLDKNRREAAAGGARYLPLEDLLTPSQLEKVMDRGLFQELKQYERVGRTVTTAEGRTKVMQLDDELMRDASWETYEIAFGPILSSDDLADLKLRWSKANSVPYTGEVPKFDARTMDTLVSEFLGPEPEDADNATLLIRDRAKQDLLDAVAATAPKDDLTARTTAQEIAKRWASSEYKIEPKGGGAAVPMALLRAQRLAPDEYMDEFQATATVRIGQVDQQVVVPLDELRNAQQLELAQSIAMDMADRLDAEGTPEAREQAARYRIGARMRDLPVLGSVLAYAKGQKLLQDYNATQASQFEKARVRAARPEERRAELRSIQTPGEQAPPKGVGWLSAEMAPWLDAAYAKFRFELDEPGAFNADVTKWLVETGAVKPEQYETAKRLLYSTRMHPMLVERANMQRIERSQPGPYGRAPGRGY